MHVRVADAGDADAISGLAAEVQAVHASAHPDLFKPGGGDTFPPDVVRARMATPGHRFLVAIDGERVIGYAYLILTDEPETSWRHRARVLTVEQMAVTAARRSRGAGTALIEAVRGEAVGSGATEVRLSVWTFNARARALYARCGFTPYEEHMRLPMRG